MKYDRYADIKYNITAIFYNRQRANKKTTRDYSKLLLRTDMKEFLQFWKQLKIHKKDKIINYSTTIEKGLLVFLKQ